MNETPRGCAVVKNLAFSLLTGQLSARLSVHPGKEEELLHVPSNGILLPIARLKTIVTWKQRLCFCCAS